MRRARIETQDKMMPWKEEVAPSVQLLKDLEHDHCVRPAVRVFPNAYRGFKAVSNELLVWSELILVGLRENYLWQSMLQLTHVGDKANESCAIPGVRPVYCFSEDMIGMLNFLWQSCHPHSSLGYIVRDLCLVEIHHDVRLVTESYKNQLTPHLEKKSLQIYTAQVQANTTPLREQLSELGKSS